MSDTKSLKRWFPGIGLFLLLSLLLASCRATTAPQPSPTVAPPASSTVAPKPTPTLSPSEAEWLKVVDMAKKEGKVTVYSYNWLSDIGLAVAAAFEKKYGITVEIITGGGVTLSERVLTEQRMKSVVADIVDSNSFNTGLVKDGGGSTSVSDIPVLQQSGVWAIDPWASDPDKHIIINTLAYMPSFINTDVVKPADEPKTFKDLTQPKWKGKMVDFDPRVVSSSGNFFATAVKRKFIDVDTVRGIGTNNVNFVATTQEAMTGLIQGRYALLLMVTPGTFTQALKQAALPVKPLAMEEGTLITNRAMVVVKGDPHPNAAKLLINWLLTSEGQTVLQKEAGLPSVRSDVPDFSPAALRVTPIKAIAPTFEDEKNNIQLFKDGWLAKLWNK